MQILKAIPTNIITGSLASGKTTVIKQLLKLKPTNERWAVLVNEFGEVGIDGALLTGAFSQKINQIGAKQTVFLREVPGGCMCCASGLPMQIALNQLISLAKPHRLLIEPTGLGHPKELIKVLGSQYYKDVIKLDTSLCLVDARRVSEQKWRNHQTFQDQVEIADVVVATKCDLYGSKDMSQLLHYLKNTSAANTPVKRAINGEIGADILSTLSQATKRLINTSSYPTKLFSTRPREGFQNATFQHNSEKLTKAKNSGDGFYSCGWIWPASHWFNYSDILHVFNTINVFRIKGLLITTAGIFGFNGHNSEMDISEYDEAFESRLEIIADSKHALQNAVEAIEKMQSINKT